MPVSEMRMSRPGSAIPATAALQKAQITQIVQEISDGVTLPRCDYVAIILDKQATHRV
jgi:hypothetical protein